jgi:hypothetical protein
VRRKKLASRQLLRQQNLSSVYADHSHWRKDETGVHYVVAVHTTIGVRPGSGNEPSQQEPCAVALIGIFFAIVGMMFVSAAIPWAHTESTKAKHARAIVEMSRA